MPVDTSAKPAAPARKPAAKPAAKPAVPALTRAQARASGLHDWFQIAALMSVMRGNLADAGAITDHGPPICLEAAELAETSETAAKLIDYAVQAGPVAALVAAIAPLAVQIAVNHKRIDVKDTGMTSGIVPPELLESKMRAAIEKKKAEYLREAAEARAEAERLTAQNGQG